MLRCALGSCRINPTLFPVHAGDVELGHLLLLNAQLLGFIYLRQDVYFSCLFCQYMAYIKGLAICRPPTKPRKLFRVQCGKCKSGGSIFGVTRCPGASLLAFRRCIVRTLAMLHLVVLIFISVSRTSTSVFCSLFIGVSQSRDHARAQVSKFTQRMVIIYSNMRSLRCACY